MSFIILPEPRKKTGLYFFAIIPDRESRNIMNPFKRDYCNRFESKQALKLPLHITLKAPFKCLGSAIMEIIDWFSEMPVQQRPFHLYLNGFGAFHNKYNPVVFIKPEPNKELMKMQRELMIGFDSILPASVHPVDRRFVPHMTIAYRDLTPENFSRAWPEYKDKPFYEVFDVHSIYLLEHDWKQWNIIATHKLR